MSNEQSKVNCPICGKKVKASGLMNHEYDAHGPASTSQDGGILGLIRMGASRASYSTAALAKSVEAHIDGRPMNASRKGDLIKHADRIFHLAQSIRDRVHAIPDGDV